MRIEQISVFVQNKPGSLASVTQLLSDAGLDIRAFSIADTTDFGIMRLIVSNPDRAAAVLRDAGLAVAKTAVLAVRLADRPGALYEVLSALAAHGVSVEYAYAFVARMTSGAYVILRVDDPDETARILEKNGIELLSSDEVYSL